MLLLSTPSVHGTADELAAQLSAVLPLVLPQATAARLLVAHPAKRELLPVRPLPPHAAGAVALDLLEKLSGDDGGGAIAYGRGLVGAAAAGGRSLYVADPFVDNRYDAATDDFKGAERLATLILPILDHRRRLLGVWQLALRPGARLAPADLALLDAASRYIRSQLHAAPLRGASAAAAAYAPLAERVVADAAATRTPVPLAQLLPLLAALPGVAVAHRWTVDAESLVETAECAAGSDELTAPARPLNIPLAASGHPACSAAELGRSVLAAVPGGRPRYALCVPVFGRDDVALAAGQRVLLGVLQLTSHPGVELGAAARAAAEQLATLHAQLNTLKQLQALAAEREGDAAAEAEAATAAEAKAALEAAAADPTRRRGPAAARAEAAAAAVAAAEAAAAEAARAAARRRWRRLARPRTSTTGCASYRRRAALRSGWR